MTTEISGKCIETLFAGSAKDYDRAHALDVPQLFAFLRATQTAEVEKPAKADEASD